MARTPPTASNPFGDTPTTLAVEHDGGARKVRRFSLTVVEGPRPGLGWQSESDRCSIGLHALNDLVIDDPTVSRFHCEVKIDSDDGTARIHDLNSRNSTFVDGVQVFEAGLRDGSLIKLGKVTVRFDLSTTQNRLPLSERTSFGGLVGGSVAMRTSFALMERAAATDFTILLEGETGTGKGEAAEAIHAASERRDKQFLVVDCGAIPENLLESELFGHEKGAFTGADQRRIGAFEEASGGTIFLDEIGELPAELQPKLLRVMENREIRRVGSNGFRPVDVRIIAATNRDLRAEVNAGRFRPDLYFRMAVVKIPLPPLRQRPDDIALLVDKILTALEVDATESAPLRTPEFLANLSRAVWPGNVRELRNYLEQALVFRDALPHHAGGEPGGGPGESDLPLTVDASVPYAEARRRVLEDFEVRYLKGLLRAHQGKVSQAATVAGFTRVHFYRLLRRHGIKP